MIEKAFTSYIFTQLQLDILLNRSGCSKIYGMDSEYDLICVSKEQVYVELADMVKSGVLKNVEDKFLMDDAVKNMINQMVTANIYVHIILNEMGRRDYMCYMKEDKVLTVSRSSVRNGKVVITELYMKDFKQYILSDIMPCREIDNKKNSDMDAGEVLVNEDKEQEMIDLYQMGILKDELKWHAKIINKSGMVMEEIYIFSEAQNLYQLMLKEGKKVRTRYGLDSDKKALMSRIESAAAMV